MKFPTLTRIFSLLLAALSVALLFTGGYNIRSAFLDRTSQRSAYEKLSEKVATFEEYSKKLQGEDTYATLKKKIDKLQEEYDDLSAEHRTDLGIYSATEGGLKDGDQTILATEVTLAQAEETLNAKQDALCTPGTAEYESLKATAYSMAQQQWEADCTAVRSGIDQAQAGIDEATLALSLLDPASEEYATAQQTIAGLTAARDEAVGKLAILSSQDTLAVYQETALATAQSAALTQLESARAQLQTGYDALDGAKNQLNDTKWGLHEDKEDLTEEKEELSDRMAELKELKEKAEQIKGDEAILSTAKVALEANENISAKVESGEELLSAAKEEVPAFLNKINTDFTLKICSCVLLILSGIFCILEPLCTFGKISNRALSILFPFMIVALCGASELISLYLGKGSLYSALSAMGVALITGILASISSKAGSPATKGAAVPEEDSELPI